MAESAAACGSWGSIEAVMNVEVKAYVCVVLAIIVSMCLALFGHALICSWTVIEIFTYTVVSLYLLTSQKQE